MNFKSQFIFQALAFKFIVKALSRRFLFFVVAAAAGCGLFPTSARSVTVLLTADSGTHFAPAYAGLKGRSEPTFALAPRVCWGPPSDYFIL